MREKAVVMIDYFMTNEALFFMCQFFKKTHKNRKKRTKICIFQLFFVILQRILKIIYYSLY